jgi:hypothetical protein
MHLARRWSWSWLALLLGNTALAAADAGTALLEPVDATEGCTEFWSSTRGAMPEHRVEAFDRLLRQRHPDLYTAKVLTLPPDRPLLEAMRQRFQRMGTKYDPDPGRVEQVRKSLPVDLRAAVVEFRRTFPDFVLRRPVYVICSMGAFDGAVREVNGQSALLFGPDTIASFRPPGFNLRPFLEHELFHVHHEALHPGTPETIASSLWEEGLATYVSDALNPGATHEEISVSDDLIRRATPLIPELSRKLLQHLDDPADGETYGYFFLGPLDRTDVPARNGYLIGWKIARELARSRSLAELARMPPEQAKSEVARVLRTFAEQADAGVSGAAAPRR